MKKRTVFLYRIHNQEGDGYAAHPLEAILTDLMALDARQRSWQHRPDDSQAFMRLVQYQKRPPKTQTSQCYAGVVAVYGDNTIATGRADDDSVRHYSLPDGRLPLQVVHFLYYADRRIMVLEHNRTAASNVRLMAYINRMVEKLSLSDKVAFVPEIICHPDAVAFIKQAHRIKSSRIVVPRQVITTNQHLLQLVRDLLGAPAVDSLTDTLGSVTLEFKPQRGTFLSPATDIDHYLRAFPGVESQSYQIEAEEGMELSTINLMQPQFKNEISLPNPTLDQSSYSEAVFTSLAQVYRAARGTINVDA